MVRIRLFQIGKKKKRMFRIVVMDVRKKRDGKYIEKLGIYNPQNKTNPFEIDIDKVNDWKKKGAQVTETVRSLIRKSSFKNLN